MKKVLGQLSKDFHKGGLTLSSLLPQITDAFNEIKNGSHKDIDSCLNMIINMITSDIKFTEEVYKWAADNNFLTEQICTAAVKSIAVSDPEKAIQMIEQMPHAPHVRTFIPIVESGHKLSLDQFNRIINQLGRYNIIPTSELFSYLIAAEPKESNIRILIEWSGQHCNTLDNNIVTSPAFVTSSITKTIDSNGIAVCQNCTRQIDIVPLPHDKRNLMLDAVFDTDNNPSIVRWVQTRDYDIVIDGANVAHYNNSPFDSKKVSIMIDKINKDYRQPKILLIFSYSRKKVTGNLVGKWENVDVFYTKSGTNDDLSWLYAALYYPNIWCITNDQMRDHIYYKFTKAVGRNVIDLWIERNIVTYNFNVSKVKGRGDVQVSLDIPLLYSVRPQMVENSVHIPIFEGWCCATV